ncbi:unnamed protein product [Anisakis simplex]|uniref:BZIP domain-containing protein n=1 Tax=Anisakis simplex TaxID=6269 RepID=A0A0M3K7E2_ANISI|nr:unnamed protein product [Anisakis simplex]
MRVIASASDEEDVVLRLKYNLLSGCMPKIIIPNERRKFAFSNDSELVKEHFTEDKCDQSPLESDELAEHLALKYGVNIISGVSSILSIVCREWLCDSANYVIPICVKHVFDKNTGRTRRLCVVGKRCVVDTINYPSLWSRFLRYSVRIALHQTQKTSALKTGGRQRAVMSKIGKTERTSSDVQKEGDGADESVTIQDNSSTREGENDSSAEAGLSGRNEADTNNAASENNGELHHSELHFLQKERYELRTLVLREERRRTLYSKRIQFLKSVLNELENLQAGNYVLRMNKENAIEILPQQQEDTTLDTMKKIEIDVKKQDEIKVSRAVGFPFEGIDEHVALVYHLMQKRIPAAFLPERQNKWRGAEVPKTSQNQQSTSNSNTPKNKKRSRKRGERKRKRNNNNNNSNTNNNSNSDNNKQQPAAKRKRIDLDAPQ